MIIALTAIAFGGYGDAVDGVPTLADRQMHLWTDATRVDPAAFTAEYSAGGCSFNSFTGTEQTPKAPLDQHEALTWVAHAHNQDMIDHNFFDHTSSDGTSLGDRIWAVYDWQWSTGVAENILYGTNDPRYGVLSGWMCSSGHRANIHDPAMVHYGGALHDLHGTQNFAYGDGTAPTAPVKVVMHDDVGNIIDFYASYGDGQAPAEVELVLDGVAHPLTLTYGTASQGVYATSVSDPGGGCHEYYARALIGGQWHHTPEQGSWGWGSCSFTDPAAQWLGDQLEVGPGSALSWGPLVAGQSVDITATGAAPGTTVHFVVGSAQGQGACPAILGGGCIDVTGTTRRVGSIVADASGSATTTWSIPALAAGHTVYLQAVLDPGSGYTTSPLYSDQAL